jgi:hypothetical protein
MEDDAKDGGVENLRFVKPVKPFMPWARISSTIDKFKSLCIAYNDDMPDDLSSFE